LDIFFHFFEYLNIRCNIAKLSELNTFLLTNTILSFMKKTFTIVVFLLISFSAFAQMPHDAIYMPKNTACLAVSYGSSSWKEYWENTLLRENLNMGKHTTQNFMPMLAVGVSDKLNVIIGLPYITTKTSAGNLMGQKGFQDFSAWIKYKLVEKDGLALHGALGASVPASKYVAEFLPMSIGLGAKTATGRVIASYYHRSGAYFAGNASYIFRSTVKIDKDGYQAYNKVYDTNIVAVPNATDARAALGYSKKAIVTELFVERFTCVGGDNIRRNDMPFITNNMQSTSIGWYGKFQPKNIGANARVAYVTNGLNVGQSMSYSLGILYQFNSMKLIKQKN